jgi:hypothetical protein
MARGGSQANGEGEVESGGIRRMTAREDNFNDGALDAMLEAIARPEAPGTLAARIGAALDARETSPVPSRFGFALTAAAALVLFCGASWMLSKGGTTPSQQAVVTHSAPSAAPHAIATPDAGTPLAQDEGAVAAAMPLRTARAVGPRSLAEHDHDRALPPLDAPPAVLQPDITPRSLETTTLEIDPMNAIAPLTVQGGRDTSGRGDF